MIWMLVFVVPATLSQGVSQHSLVGAPVLTFASTFPTQAKCEQAGKGDYTHAGRMTPDSAYMCLPFNTKEILVKR